MSEFDFPAPAAQPRPARFSWGASFTSTLAAVLVAGLLLGLGARWYIRWSVRDSWEQASKDVSPWFQKTDRK